MGIETENDDYLVAQAQRAGDGSAQVIQVQGVPATLLWLNTTLATLGAAAGVIALTLTMTRLNDYADRLALEERVKTQAIDEARVEANVSRKLAGLPQVNAQEHD